MVTRIESLWLSKSFNIDSRPAIEFYKNSSFFCLWDSKDRQNHDDQIEWLKRTKFHPGTRKIIHSLLNNPSNILLVPLHIKLDLMKQFMNVLNKGGDCSKYLGENFPVISDAKLKEIIQRKKSVVNGPQIRIIFQDKNFTNHMNGT